MKRNLIILLFTIAAFIAGYAPHTCSESFGTRVQSASWLPPGATDGAFYRGGTLVIIGPPYSHYEFSISETDFKSFATDRGKKLEEIIEPVYVRRYLDRFIRKEDFRMNGDIDYDSYNEAVGVTINNGLIWSYYFEDESYVIAFDRSLSRAFIELNYR
ncbi:MAG: hypothetical protein L3J39_06615 [Verrucomicrobiales bacterium]|nr:hypothetical protein [Verrucomicrobiales bacterium]